MGDFVVMGEVGELFRGDHYSRVGEGIRCSIGGSVIGIDGGGGGCEFTEASGGEWNKGIRTGFH